MISPRSKAKDSLDRLRHYRHIIAILAKYGFEEVADGVRTRFSAGAKKQTVTSEIGASATNASRPARMRHALEELGPAFIKFGQLLSTRPDLVAPEYISEFELLQDHVPPVAAEEIIRQTEQELGNKIDKVFNDFDERPIAAGSIAQIHLAVLLDGSKVAVKVRRPGIVRTVRTECDILTDLTVLLKSILLRHETVSLEDMVASVVEAVIRETDLASERRNQLRFARLFANDSTVHIPRVYESYCSEAVLTMEFIEGVKPTETAVIAEQGLDRGELARRGARFVLRQMFEFGLFHTDPHPGNLLLLPDNVLVPIDFGQVGRLSSQDRHFFNEIVLSIVDRDAEHIVRCLVRQNMLADRTSLRKLTADIEQLFDMYHDFTLKDIPFGAVVTQTFELFRDNFVRPPDQFALMLKSMVTIESLATGLDPEFRLIEALRPYARRSSLADLDPKQVLRTLRKTVRGAGDVVSSLPEDVNAILTKFRQGKLQVRVHHEHLENLAKTLDKSSNRISFALIIAALLVGSSLLVAQEGTVLGLFSLQTMGVLGYVIAAIIGIWLVISIIRSRHI